MFKQNKTIKLFAKAFLISIVALLAAVGIGWLVVDNTIAPPEVPNIAVAIPLAPIETENENSSSGQRSAGDAEDESSDHMPPPHLIMYEERRPYFFTFLIFGLTEGLHANTVMIAAYDAYSRQAYIISIPRDTEVDVQRTRRKIVNAYPTGFAGGRGHDGGVARMKYEVQTLIGFRPDFYIKVDYAAFTRMVDAVGGVEIYVPFHMRYDDPWQNLHINIPAGLQVLDGNNALHFARYRMGNDRRMTISDYRRIEHQQQVLAAVAYELLHPASLLRIPYFIGIFNDYVESDLAAGELLWLANQGRLIGGLDALDFYTLPTSGTSGAPYWYELPDRNGILELVNRTVNPLMRDITADDLRLAR